MTRKIIVMLALVLLPMLTIGVETGAAQSGYCASEEEAALLWEINSFRQENGLQPLALSYPLGVAGQMKATDMATRNYFSHVSPDGQGPRQLLNNAGYTYNTAYGENLAAGNASGSATFLQWLNSPSHREIMLGSEYTAVGIGSDYADGSAYGWYWAAEFGGVVGDTAAVCDDDPGGSSSVEAIVAIIVDIITRLLAG